MATVLEILCKSVAVRLRWFESTRSHHKSIAIHPRQKRKAHCYAFVLPKRLGHDVPAFSINESISFLRFQLNWLLPVSSTAQNHVLGTNQNWLGSGPDFGFVPAFSSQVAPCPHPFLSGGAAGLTVTAYAFIARRPRTTGAAKTRAVGPLSLLGAPSSNGWSPPHRRSLPHQHFWEPVRCRRICAFLLCYQQKPKAQKRRPRREPTDGLFFKVHVNKKSPNTLRYPATVDIYTSAIYNGADKASHQSLDVTASCGARCGRCLQHLFHLWGAFLFAPQLCD